MSATTNANRHDREEHHTGTMWSTLVGISSALGTDIPQDMTLEEAIAVLDARISRLESADLGFGSFVLDAYLMAKNFLVDAVVKRTRTGSFVSYSTILRERSGSLTMDSWIGTITEGDAQLGTFGLGTQSLGDAT